MIHIKPFRAIRPQDGLEDKIASLPYDVFNRKEAKKYVEDKPFSFLNIDRAETQFDDTINTYDDIVYEKAANLFQNFIQKGYFVKEKYPCFYLYELAMNSRKQTGIVSCASIDDYLNSSIKKHENTREDKEIDRIRHVDTLDAQTGPIFLAYRRNDILKNMILNEQKKEPLYDFISEDHIGHKVWVIDDPITIETIQNVFLEMDCVYIADGHHRCASAVKVGVKRRKENPMYTGEEEFNYFLSVLFSDDELFIMDYNRVVKDLNGYTEEEFLNLLSKSFEISKPQKDQVKPNKKGQFSMFLNDKWFVLRAKEGLYGTDPVKNLDVSILQDYCLSPILNIKDPKTDQRIDFVGGIRGLDELERRVHSDMTVAFAMFPTSIEELFQVADAEKLMPPKSTWFEPKLRSGIFIHSLK